MTLLRKCRPCMSWSVNDQDAALCNSSNLRNKWICLSTSVLIHMSILGTPSLRWFDDSQARPKCRMSTLLKRALCGAAQKRPACVSCDTKDGMPAYLDLLVHMGVISSHHILAHARLLPTLRAAGSWQTVICVSAPRLMPPLHVQFRLWCFAFVFGDALVCQVSSMKPDEAGTQHSQEVPGLSMSLSSRMFLLLPPGRSW